jgi:hypothetical protein
MVHRRLLLLLWKEVWRWVVMVCLVQAHPEPAVYLFLHFFHVPPPLGRVLDDRVRVRPVLVLLLHELRDLVRGRVVLLPVIFHRRLVHRMDLMMTTTMAVLSDHSGPVLARLEKRAA